MSHWSEPVWKVLKFVLLYSGLKYCNWFLFFLSPEKGRVVSVPWKKSILETSWYCTENWASNLLSLEGLCLPFFVTEAGYLRCFDGNFRKELLLLVISPEVRSLDQMQDSDFTFIRQCCFKDTWECPGGIIPVLYCLSTFSFLIVLLPSSSHAKMLTSLVPNTKFPPSVWQQTTIVT